MSVAVGILSVIELQSLVHGLLVQSVGAGGVYLSG